MNPGLITLRWNTVALVASGWLTTAHPLNAAQSLRVCSPDGTCLATAAEHGRIQYYTCAGDSVQSTFYICHPRAIAFSEDGTLLAAVGGTNGNPAKIKIWRLADRQQLCEIVTNGQEIRALAVSEDGHLVA